MNSVEGPSDTVTEEIHRSFTRRRILSLGAAGLAGAALTKSLTSGEASARPSFGGIHLNITAKLVQPPPPNDNFVHTFIATLWGTDDSMSGIGIGFTEGSPTQNLASGALADCIYSAWGSIQDGVLTGKGVMVYAADMEENRGQPFTFEARLSDGFGKFVDMNFGMGPSTPIGPSLGPVVAEGYGRVTRI